MICMNTEHRFALTGTIPAALGDVSLLTRLNLGDLGNGKCIESSWGFSIDGWHPSTETFKEICPNELAGTIPPAIGNLTKLTYLDLNYNQLTGTIPATFCKLTKLEKLYLFGNQLTGCVPECIDLCASSLSDWRSCWIKKTDGNAGITGTCVPTSSPSIPTTSPSRAPTSSPSIPTTSPTRSPSTRGKFEDDPCYTTLTASSTTMSCSRKGLTGTIPPKLGDYTSLTSLNFQENALSGSIPPELGKLTDVTELLFNCDPWQYDTVSDTGFPTTRGYNCDGSFLNSLVGTIPPELSNLKHLTEIRMFFVKLTGTIPPELGDLSKLKVANMVRNKFSGPYSSYISHDCRYPPH